MLSDDDSSSMLSTPKFQVTQFYLFFKARPSPDHGTDLGRTQEPFQPFISEDGHESVTGPGGQGQQNHTMNPAQGGRSANSAKRRHPPCVRTILFASKSVGRPGPTLTSCTPLCEHPGHANTGQGPGSALVRVIRDSDSEGVPQCASSGL